ncbi:hypothetical protein [Salmonella enterica]
MDDPEDRSPTAPAARLAGWVPTALVMIGIVLAAAWGMEDRLPGATEVRL